MVSGTDVINAGSTNATLGGFTMPWWAWGFIAIFVVFLLALIFLRK